MTTAVFLPAPLFASALVDDGPWLDHAVESSRSCEEPQFASVEDNDRSRRPPRPPREAIEACQGKQSGDACSFEGRQGESVEGTCWKPPKAGDDKPLACRPKNPPPRPGS